MSNAIYKLYSIYSQDTPSVFNPQYPYVKFYPSPDSHVIGPYEWSIYAKEYMNFYEFQELFILSVDHYRGDLTTITFDAQ